MLKINEEPTKSNPLRKLFTSLQGQPRRAVWDDLRSAGTWNRLCGQARSQEFMTGGGTYFVTKQTAAL